MKRIANAFIVIAVCGAAGCTNYLYQADLSGKDAYGKERQFVLYWTKTDPIIGEPKAGPAVLLTECSPTTRIDFSDKPEGVVFRGMPGYDRLPDGDGAVDQNTVCGRIITYSTLVDAQAGQLSLQMICMPVQDNEFALQPRNYLAARPEPYVFPVMEKIKKWSLTGETLAAPAVPDCREAR